MSYMHIAMQCVMAFATFCLGTTHCISVLGCMDAETLHVMYWLTSRMSHTMTARISRLFGACFLLEGPSVLYGNMCAMGDFAARANPPVHFRLELPGSQKYTNPANVSRHLTPLAALRTRVPACQQHCWPNRPPLVGALKFPNI